MSRALCLNVVKLYLEIAALKVIKIDMKWSILLFIFTIFCGQSAEACTLVMGYRTTPRLPNIEAVPNNSGIYQDLYSIAAKKIGCKLEIVRLPKKRVLLGMAEGRIDFYPGFTFTKARTKNTFFFENGMRSKMVGLSRADMPEVHSLEEIRGKIFLRPLGAPGVDAQKYGFILHEVPELDYTQAIKLLQKKHADFFMDHYLNLKFFMQNHPERKQFRFHMNCCGKDEAFTIGFSKKSKFYEEEPNLSFDENKPLNYNNYPVQLKKGCIAYRLQQALRELSKTGVTDAIIQTYYRS